MIWVWVSLHCYSAPRICCFAVTQPSRRCAFLLLPDPFSSCLRPGCTQDTVSRETAACPPMICAVGREYMPMSACLSWGWLVLVLISNTIFINLFPSCLPWSGACSFPFPCFRRLPGHPCICNGVECIWRCIYFFVKPISTHMRVWRKSYIAT